MLDKIKQTTSKALGIVDDAFWEIEDYVLNNIGTVVLVVGTALIATLYVDSKFEWVVKEVEEMTVHVKIYPKDFTKVE